MEESLGFSSILTGTPNAFAWRELRVYSDMTSPLIAEILGTVLTAVSVTTWIANVSEASLLVIWGGVLLLIARSPRLWRNRQTLALMVRQDRDAPTVDAIRLQPGV